MAAGRAAGRCVEGIGQEMGESAGENVSERVDKAAAPGWTTVRPREYHIVVVRRRTLSADAALLPDLSDEATMEIQFPADAPAYRDSNLTVVFSALVDGE